MEEGVVVRKISELLERPVNMDESNVYNKIFPQTSSMLEGRQCNRLMA